MRCPEPLTRRLVLATAGVALLPGVARTQPGNRYRIAALAQGSRAYDTENGRRSNKDCASSATPSTAEKGGLAAYGPRLATINHMSVRQVVRVLRGAKPAELPVEQPDKFKLVINLRAAKAIGLEVPAALLDRADQVIADQVIE